MEEFLKSLDTDNDGYISYAEVEAKLDLVHDEIAPQAKAHNLHHESREDEETPDPAPLPSAVILLGFVEFSRALGQTT